MDAAGLTARPANLMWMDSARAAGWATNQVKETYTKPNAKSNYAVLVANLIHVLIVINFPVVIFLTVDLKSEPVTIKNIKNPLPLLEKMVIRNL